jgi:hypothetical protein
MKSSWIISHVMFCSYLLSQKLSCLYHERLLNIISHVAYIPQSRLSAVQVHTAEGTVRGVRLMVPCPVQTVGSVTGSVTALHVACPCSLLSFTDGESIFHWHFIPFLFTKIKHVHCKPDVCT